MKYSFLALLLILCLQSCMYDATETTANNDIDKSLRETMRAKNDSLLNALSNSDMKAFQKLGSPDFLKHLQGNIGNVVWAFRKGFLDTEFEVYNEYYNKHSSVPNNSQIISEKDAYTFTFKNNSEETYVSFLKVVYNGMDDYLVTTIHEVVDGQWKLTSVHIDPFGIYGKNAQEYYELAQKKKEEGYIIDAYNYINVASHCMHPSGDKFKYDNEDRIEFYAKTWKGELNNRYKFPKMLENIRTQPYIISLDPIKNSKGLYPVFNYITKIPASDTVTLKEENELVKAEVRKAYPDLDFNADYIYYRAYNDINKPYEFHSFEEVRK